MSGNANRVRPINYDKLAPEVAALYGRPLPASRTGAMYNAFPYPTKISAESIAVFLATHTKPGDTVLDCFAGAGSTGLAGLLCDKPTAGMKEIARALGVTPKWGPRNVAMCELSVLGAFAAKTLCSQVNSKLFERSAKAMVAEAKRRLPDLYGVVSPNGDPGELRYAVWSEILICPRCGERTSFWDAAARRKPARLVATFKCRGCERRIEVSACERATESVFDPHIGHSVERRKRTIAAVYGRSGKSTWNRPAIAEDNTANKSAENYGWPATAPLYEMQWGDLYRAGYHQGISHLHHLYTPRNFLAVATLLEVAEEFDPGLRDALRLLVLSYNTAHCTLMTRIVAKHGQADFSASGAQSGVLYVSALPIEKNVFEGVLRKVKPFSETYALTAGSRSKVSVQNGSSTQLALVDSSISYAFTDPPFGDYIPYAEINQISEAWMGALTNRSEEAIVSRAQGKRVDDYCQLMSKVFKELSRVLKPNGLATVVFHSAESKVWNALMQAYSDAELEVLTTSVLDKAQPSFKQVVSEDSVRGDPLILLRKVARETRDPSEQSISSLIDELLDQAQRLSRAEREPQRLYSRFVARCLELGVEVSVGAKEFYGRARDAVECAA